MKRCNLHNKNRKYPGRAQRHGITLLMVVSIIVLFLLMGTAFVVLATQFRRSSTALSHQRERRDDASTLVTRAFFDLLREPGLENSASPLRGHSLLGDMYGYGWTASSQPRSNLVTVSNSVLKVRLTGSVISDLSGQTVNLDTFDNAYNGRTLSITSVYDPSGRRVPFRPVTGIITGFEGLTTTFTVALAVQDNASLQRLRTLGGTETFDTHVNQRPFSGSGAGQFQQNPIPGSPALSLTSLNPNRKGESRAALINSYLSNTNGDANFSSTNEDYDAVDFQNMYLAGARYNSALPPISPRLTVTPSFFRPELTNFLGVGTSPINPADSLASPNRRDIFLANLLNRNGDAYYRDVVKLGFFLGIPDVYEDRDANGIPDYSQDLNGDGISDRLQDVVGADGNASPNQINDLSDAVGGTLNYDLDKDGMPDIMAWDVDSDGDGILDSIWTDPDYPVQTDMKGNVYKPLVAYYVLDMDGRLNANAHGNKLELNSAAITPYGLYNGNTSLCRGQGYGPPEIRLSLSGLNATALYNGNGSFYPGRYGFDGGSPPLPGIQEQIDTKSAAMFSNLPNDTFQNGGLVNPGFRSWMDIHGQIEVGVPRFLLRDVRKNPFNSSLPDTNDIPIGLPIANAEEIQNTSNLALPVLVDSAYELDFSNAPFSPSFQTGIDAPFSPGELERVLRQSDPDFNALPPRLEALINDKSFRHSLTTESFEVPVPPRFLPALLGLKFPSLDLRNVFTPEVLAGKKMNLNAEWTTPQQRYLFAKSLYYVTLLATEWQDLQYDYDQDGSPIGNDANMNGLADDTESFRLDIAQWVANVVDFRDGDSINTGFEFDLKPFSDETGDNDPWDLDGDLATPSPNPSVLMARIFGSERPELLITETLTLHDRRTEDLNSDDGDNDNYAGNDDDFDSRYTPNASTFIELYNPHVHTDNNVTNANTELRPAELSHPTLSGGVHLNKLAPGGAPVWRLRIIKTSPDTNSNSISPDDNPKILPADVARLVYFIRPSDPTVIAEAGAPEKIYFPALNISNDAPPNPRRIGIQPGQRAVIGSAGRVVGDEYRTYIGRRIEPDWFTRLDETRRISLNPTAGTVSVTWWDSAVGNWSQFISNDVVAIPVGKNLNPTDVNGPPLDRSLGLTDPVAGYGTGLTNPLYGIRPVADGYEFYDTSNPSGGYVTLDTPADKLLQPTNWAAFPYNSTNPDGGLLDDGLLGSCFSIHLQRLADPTNPYNAATNPYLTVDYLGSDVLTFNGLSSSGELDDLNPIDPTLKKAFNSFDRADFEVKWSLDRLLWKGTQDGTASLADAIPVSNPSTGDQHFFPFNLEVSLGQIDLNYRQGPPPPKGSSFAWLRWNNRPFVSHLELIEVPYTPQGLLTSRFYIKNIKDNPYDGVNTSSPSSAFPNKAGQFNHLLGFHHDSILAPPTPPINPSGSPALHRALDYLEVPSRFGGTALNPEPSWPLVPESINTNTFRYPGKINLNTISDIRVFRALMGSYGILPTIWQDFELSRRGNGVYPTEIPFPFRAGEFYNFVPHDSLVRRSAQSTLFRAKDPNNTPITPLLEYQPPDSPHADSSRNSYFNYDMRQRLGNLTTTRSSVFAVWVTVGFFEVDPDTQRPIQEIGIEDGTSQRYRGYYLIDRSIPVAFQPGENHDIEKCILSSTIIQHEVQSGGRR